MDAPLQILTVTTYFPNAVDRHRTVFVLNLVEALRKHCAVNVIAPVPYAPPFVRKAEWLAKRAVPATETVGSVQVTHPRFLVVPGAEALTGIGYFFGILSALRAATRGRERLLVHAHCAYPDAVGVALACRLLRLPFVVTAHGSDLNVYAQRRDLRRQIGWALRQAAGVIVVSARLREKASALMGSSTANVVCIPCAAYDPNVFAPMAQQAARNRLGLPATARLLLFVGQLVPVKGLETLVAAVSQLRQNGLLGDADRLVLLGKGPCRAALDAQARQARLAEHVRFVDPVPQDSVALWMNAADVLCLPSRNEGTPNVVIEALACGLPVVASAVGGVPDLIVEGLNGHLVPPSDSNALAAALRLALARTWDRQAVAATVTDRTWQHIAARNHAFLDALT